MGTIVGGTWSYSGDPTADSKDKVRFLIGDTDGNDQKLSDEEILWLISSEGNIYRAAAMCCEHIVTSARLVDRKIGDLEIRASAQAANFTSLAASLRRRAAASSVPYAGGISRSDKWAQNADTDRVVPAFAIGSHDYPGVPQSAGSSTST